MKRLEKKHPLAIRWVHWINFPMLAVMIWSGLLIYWANDVYRIGLDDFTLFKFFPETVYETLNLSHRLAEGMAFHFFFMWQTKLVTPQTDLTAQSLLTGKFAFVSPGVVATPEEMLGFRKRFLVRDPDGHVMQLIEKR